MKPSLSRLLPISIAYFLAAGLAASAWGAAPPAAAPLRAGMIGLDTSHVVAFADLLQAAKPGSDLGGLKVVAGFPGGSPDNPQSWNRVKEYTENLRRKGVEIVGSIDELLDKVDVVMLMSVDGRPHLAQARPAIAKGKPLYIDKPMAASLADAMEIFRLAEEKKVPCFSASSLRFSAGFQAARKGAFGEIKSCTAWSPMHIEPHHPDLFWYGIHGVETLYTIMGPGCETVTRAGPEKVVGRWPGGRTGTFIAKEKDYGAEVQGSKKSGPAGKYDGYRPLLVEIVRFFKTGKPPVDAQETLEILAFMEAADQSKREGGAAVTVRSVMERARGRR